MNKALKLIVLFLGLALVAGLFVWLNSLDFGTSISNESTSKEVAPIETQSAISDTTVDSAIPATPSTGWSQQDLASEISKTVKFESDNGEVKVTYAQPEIPKEYHLTFKVEIFDSTGKTIDRYISDAGWLSDKSCYDPSEKLEEILMNVTDMNNKMAFVVVKVGDKDLSKSAHVYQLTVNYDGSMVWNNAEIK